MSIQESDHSTGTESLNVDLAVRERYSGAAREREELLCCPVEYNQGYLTRIPQEIIERDYGCGDPSRHLHPGETVLDLGSGGGKICYIAAQVVGATGRVIGVDCNLEMLSLARKYQQQMADELGYANVEFRRGKIEDLQLDLDRLEAELSQRPVGDAQAWLEAQELADRLRKDAPLVADNSVDVVVSNCVLNLVSRQRREMLFAEIFRVLKPGGRAVISDITCDRPVPQRLQNDPQLWSGCISGAFCEPEFLEAFAEAGLVACQILERSENPWQQIEEIEFRSMTVAAYKPVPAQSETNVDVIYRGPWPHVQLEDGLVLTRGERVRLSSTQAAILGTGGYRNHGILIGSTAAASAGAPGGELVELSGFSADSGCCGGGSCC
ncbi:MAG: methyltransferase domain-containing protein [Planctomycetaceae bacterium]|nr:methyltransferase domain-containing protein [Planctomycetaceae bacterium]